MPRLIESRSWELLREVPAEFFRLVKEVLSLRQQIVLARQTIKLLRRCLQHRVVPNFIKKKRPRNMRPTERKPTSTGH